MERYDLKAGPVFIGDRKGPNDIAGGYSNMKTYRAGIDIGSTTVKLVILNDKNE